MYETDTCRNCGKETTGPVFFDELGPHMVCKHCEASFDTDKFYEVIDMARSSEIIRTRQPEGLFLLEEGGKFIGIDNSTGDAWTEEFGDRNQCLQWLAGLFEVE